MRLYWFFNWLWHECRISRIPKRKLVAIPVPEFPKYQQTHKSVPCPACHGCGSFHGGRECGVCLGGRQFQVVPVRLESSR